MNEHRNEILLIADFWFSVKEKKSVYVEIYQKTP